jgi:hypothetical protein
MSVQNGFNFVYDCYMTTHFSDVLGQILFLYWGKYSILDVKQMRCELDMYNSDNLNMNIQFPE